MADVPYGDDLRRFRCNGVILRYIGGSPAVKDSDGDHEVPDHDLPGVRHHSVGAVGGSLLYGILYGE